MIPIQTLEKLISLPMWGAYIEMIEAEIKMSESQAFESIGSDKPNKDAYYRAKYLREALSLPENKIKASKMNLNKTKLN